VIWGDVTSENVVWGWTCAGADCNLPAWNPAMRTDGASSNASEEDTVVWGTTDEGDTVVWGTTEEGDTVVWGTADEGDTVVWGTSTGEDKDLDTSCEEPQLSWII